MVCKIKFKKIKKLRVSTVRGQILLMYLQVKMPENGRKNIFREMQTTNKVPLIF